MSGARRPVLRLIVVLFLAVVAISVGGGSLVWHLLGITDDLSIGGRAARVANVPGNAWTAYGGDAGGMRYTDATEITPANVDSLERAWTYHSKAFEGRERLSLRASFQVTPLFVENLVVFCTQFNEVLAITPDTGQERWRFDPKVNLDANPGNGFTCRGVSYWRGSEDAWQAGQACSSRLFMGTVDARLVALDARTGEPCEDFGAGGEVPIVPEVALLWPGEFQVTSAPAIAGNVVIVGSAISDNNRVAAPPGTVRAFDVLSGKALWSFDPVPRDPDDPARGSWETNTAESPGHANVWSTMSVDRERGLVFLPTSSASPDFYGGLRGGDNRYANSVVALAAETGEVVWDFQTVHHDVWDYDVPAQPGLYTLTQTSGETRDVVVQFTKTGFMFVLDRDTGVPVLPVEERPVPQDGIEGEKLSPTQPYPVTTPPIVPNRLNAGDAFGVTLWDRLYCRSRLAALRSEGLFTPPSREGTVLRPFTGGGANWGSAAFDPSRNLAIINMSNTAHVVTLFDGSERESIGPVLHDAEFAPMAGAPYSMTREMLMSPLGLPCTPPPWGVLAAVNVETGTIVWRRAYGSVRRFAGGVDLELGMPSLGGPMTTPTGLIFIGAAVDDLLRAFDTETGVELWRASLPAGGQATPMSYVYEGRQYVVIAAGGHKDSGLGTGDAVVAFALPQ